MKEIIQAVEKKQTIKFGCKNDRRFFENEILPKYSCLSQLLHLACVMQTMQLMSYACTTGPKAQAACVQMNFRTKRLHVCTGHLVPALHLVL